MALRQTGLALVRRFRFLATLSIAGFVMLAASCGISKSISRASSGRSRRSSSRGKRTPTRRRMLSCCLTARVYRPGKTATAGKLKTAAIVGGGEIETKQEFGDCQLHIEWSSPVPARGEPGPRQQRRFPDGAA